MLCLEVFALAQSPPKSTQTKFTPPMRQGITASLVFLPKAKTEITTFAYLCQQFPHIQPQEWQQRFDDGLVFNTDGQQLSIHTPYLSEQHLYYYRHLPHEVIVPFEHQVLFENDQFMLVDKPHFLTVSPTGQYVQQTLLTRLKQHTNNPFLTPIHRLDRETAGLILISKNPQTRGIYQQLFAEKKVQKTYHAIAPFNPHLQFPIQFSARMEKGDPFYTMQIVAGDINSITDIALLEHHSKVAKYELKPITGKQHQLRVHMNALGLALKNDRIYPHIQHLGADHFSEPLQLLAKSICFIDPISNEQMDFQSKQDLNLD